MVSPAQVQYTTLRDGILNCRPRKQLELANSKYVRYDISLCDILGIVTKKGMQACQRAVDT
jgi:hypothetical protein